ncbi:MAG: N-acetylmuramoyl-L-alanine amidase [Acidobacteriales bacterium]|nr:N-acetylmuramoyl-L-alanine amidase [Terriglobales bacterium]
MRWNNRPSLAISLVSILTLAAATLLLSAPSGERRISIYSAAANYSLPVLVRNGVDYVGLLEILEPLGSVSSKLNGQRWKMRYNNIEGEFDAGSSRARLHGSYVDLPSPFLLEEDHGLIPVSSLSNLLPLFLGGPVTFHESARRVFVGDVAVHFTAQMSDAAPSTLVMNFSSPVNPKIATETGKLHMTFTHVPVVASGTPTLAFNDKTISSASFLEANGAAEITIAGKEPLFASFSNDGRTITIAAAPRTPPPQPAQVIPPAPPVASGSAAPHGPHFYFAVIDAAHGGEERGAALSDTVAEKDVTLAFARRLRQELDGRGLKSMLLRDGDTTLSLDQRANLANTAHAGIYICVHADSEGAGVRLYTALLPAGGENRGPFLDWDTAQASSMAQSESSKTGLAAVLQARQISVRSLVAPLRPLNNILIPALAIELVPPAAGVSGFGSPEYQQRIAGAIAEGLYGMRAQLETR